MLSWVVTFLVIALIAGVLGFGGLAGASIEIAKIIFFVAIVLFLVSAVVGLARADAGLAARLILRAPKGRVSKDAVPYPWFETALIRACATMAPPLRLR